MILLFSLLINFSLIFIFFIIGSLFSKFKFLSFSKKVLFGLSIFLIINYFLFFVFYFSINQSIFILFSIITLIIINILITKKIIDFKKSCLEILKYILPISILYIITALVYGEQFYVFRGNHWDLFSYLSIASLFNEVTFNEIVLGDFPNFFYHFLQIEKLYTSRPLTSYLLGLFLNIKVFDIYLLVFLFKTLFIILTSISISNLINDFKIENHNEKYLISILFAFSFWLLYIFEIDALSHLVSIPIFILVISEIFSVSKYVKRNDKYFLFYFSIINSALFLIYPEIFIFSSLIFFICFCIDLYENKSFIKKYLSYFFKGFIIFIGLTLFAFKTNYIFLYEQYSQVFTNTKDWWGYYGAFILGKENLVLDKNIVSLIEDFVGKNDILSSLKYILDLHLSNGYNFFYLNILPSFLGLYFLSIGKLENFFNYTHLFLIIIFSLYLIFRIYKNFVALISNKKIILNLIFFFIVFLILLFNSNLWSVIKLYFYLSPLLFLFLIFKFEKFKKKISTKTNYLIVFLLLIFPIYKYSSFNDGIGRIDSFPSILNTEIKTNFLWKVKLDQLKNCNYIKLNIDDYVKKSYLILKLNYYFSKNIFDNNKIKISENKIICEIKNEGNRFVYEKK